MFSTLLIALLAQAAPVAVQAVEVDPGKMNKSEIREYNAQLNVNDPNYIRCKKWLETGSLVKSTVSCRTNKQWQQASDEGNRNARDTYEKMNSHLLTGN